MYRYLELSKFRNLGFDKPDSLIINSSLNKGETGGLVTLIGQNNAGKSNVLAALTAVGSNFTIAEKDRTYLSFDPADKIPTISLVYKDGENYIKISRTYGKDIVVDSNIPEANEPSLETIKKEAANLEKNLPNGYHLISMDMKKCFVAIESDEITKEGASKFLTQLITLLQNFENNQHAYGATHITRDIINAFNRFKETSICYAYYCLKNGLDCTNFCKEYLKKYDISLIPTVAYYKEKNLSENDLVLNGIQSLNKENFFGKLFNILEINLEEIRETYKEYGQHNNPAILRKEERKIECKMKIVNNRFNKLYFAESDSYKFGVNLESGKILFSMARGKDEDPINLDSQSTGFKWFFNLYFNYLGNNPLKNGDILIMDEAGYALHPKGLNELRKFLYEYGRKTGVTFVIATHNPFLIDNDYLEELRIISLKDNKAYIDNRFSAVNDEDPDSLLPIKEAMTIKQNVLYDFDTEVCWVEGITDYCYLTMFKNLLDIKGISFLPFNGVGYSKETTNRILKRLLEIKFFKRSILVDGDKAGLDMFGQCKGTAFDSYRHNISELNNANHKYITIEDLFSAEDKEKYPATNYKREDKYKKHYLVSAMKNNCQLSDFSDETIKNFKKLFELIID